MGSIVDEAKRDAIAKEDEAIMGRKRFIERVDCDAREVEAQTEGVKHDAGKARYDLIPADALASLVAVYTVGAKKYADRNWELGMSWGRVFAAIGRHTWAWMRGEENDPEDGLPHMAHAAWGCMTLVAYGMRKVGRDDRPKLGGTA